MTGQPATPSSLLRAVGQHLVATCPRHERPPDPERPWLPRQSSAPCSVCRDLPAIGLEPVPEKST
jgi:hypothetical protein